MSLIFRGVRALLPEKADSYTEETFHVENG